MSFASSLEAWLVSSLEKLRGLYFSCELNQDFLRSLKWLLSERMVSAWLGLSWDIFEREPWDFSVTRRVFGSGGLDQMDLFSPAWVNSFCSVLLKRLQRLRLFFISMWYLFRSQSYTFFMLRLPIFSLKVSILLAGFAFDSWCEALRKSNPSSRIMPFLVRARCSSLRSLSVTWQENKLPAWQVSYLELRDASMSLIYLRRVFSSGSAREVREWGMLGLRFLDLSCGRWCACRSWLFLLRQLSLMWGIKQTRALASRISSHLNIDIEFSYMLSPLSTQKALEQKLARLDEKLKIITHSYLKLKLLLQDKDEQIKQLQLENHRIRELHEQKQNDQLTQLRRKYEMDTHVLRKDSLMRDTRMSTALNIEPNIRLAKSTSPALKNTYNFAIPKLKEESRVDYHHFQEKANVNRSSQVRNDKMRHTVGVERSEPMVEKSVGRFEMSKEVAERSRVAVEPKGKREGAEGKREGTEVLILQELWEERDRQIRRMDELFQNLNQRINSPT